MGLASLACARMRAIEGVDVRRYKHRPRRAKNADSGERLPRVDNSDLGGQALSDQSPRRRLLERVLVTDDTASGYQHPSIVQWAHD